MINSNNNIRMKSNIILIISLLILVYCTDISISNKIKGIQQTKIYINNDNNKDNNIEYSNNNDGNNNKKSTFSTTIDLINSGSGSNSNDIMGNSGELTQTPIPISYSKVSGNMTGTNTPNCKTCTSSNFTYSEEYDCSSDLNGWANGFIFHDPVPSNELIVVHRMSVNFTGYFNFNINESSGGIVVVLLNSEDNVGIIPVQTNTSTCSNCQLFYKAEQVPILYPNGIPSYKYGSSNSLYFNLFQIELGCISEVYATIYYGPVGFKVSGVFPNTSASTGGERVYFQGDKFYNSSDIQCRFGTQISSGTFISPNNISCIVPPMAQVSSLKPSDYNVTIQISEDGGVSFCAPTTYFIYYAASIPYKQPQNYQKLIWIIIGVSIAVVLIIAVGIYFIIKLRLKNNRLNGSKHALPIGINDDDRSPLLKTDYKTLFEIKPIDISEIVVQNRIGRGSCAEVFTGTWRGIIVAIKKAKLLNEDDEDFLNELAQEATIMSQLRHPNICQFLGTCNNPPEILIVMEYMPLGSLYRILHDPTITLDWPRMKSMALDIAKGMNYLHCCDPIVIHRDLKSHNLLVDEHFRVKISDFGLSTRFKKHLDKKTAMTPVGTPCWTAPEVLRNDTYTEKADVFSFAIVLWEIVTREDPYQGMPTFQIVISVGQHKLRPIVPPQVSAPFTRLITECWSEDPQQRPSFQEIVKRLEAM